MPKILRVVNRFIVGGLARDVLNLTYYIGDEFETLLVVGNKDPDEKGAEPWAEECDIKPIYISEMTRNVNLIKDFKSFMKLRKIIKEYKPDIVHTHGAKSGAIGRLAAFSMRVPIVVHTYHGHIFHSYFGKIKTFIYILLDRILAIRTDAIIAISKQQRGELQDKFKIANAKKFFTIPLGFDLERFQKNYKEKRAAFRREFSLSGDTVAIGIIGRLVPIKNHLLFIESIEFLLKESNKKICAFIIGDGELKKKMMLEADKRHIKYTSGKEQDYSKYSLIFTSWRIDIEYVHAGLDIVALTSLNEGTPVSLFEGQAANKAIVATKVGGVEDVVEENVTGLLSNINDKKLFMNNLLRVVNDDSLRKRLGQDSFERIKERFNYTRLIKDITHVYHLLLQSKDNGKPS